MTDDTRLALIHAEIDGELDERQRAELARSLLADPQIRSLREELRRTCAALENLEPLDPPPELKQTILDALPQFPSAAMPHGRATPQWRYAAAIAAVLIGATVVYEVGISPMPGSDTAGTIAPGAASFLSAARIEGVPLSGWLRLYRDPRGLSLQYDLASKEPADMVIAGEGKTLRINHVGGTPASAASQQRVPLVGFGVQTRSVEVTFFMEGRAVARATLRVSQER